MEKVAFGSATSSEGDITARWPMPLTPPSIAMRQHARSLCHSLAPLLHHQQSDEGDRQAYLTPVRLQLPDDNNRRRPASTKIRRGFQEFSEEGVLSAERWGQNRGGRNERVAWRVVDYHVDDSGGGEGGAGVREGVGDERE